VRDSLQDAVPIVAAIRRFNLIKSTKSTKIICRGRQGT